MIQLIFSDIDGTLLNSAFLVTDRTKKAIKKAVQNGKVFVPISARMPKAIEPIIASISVSFSYFSLESPLLL